jgi:hypothetical protein
LKSPLMTRSPTYFERALRLNADAFASGHDEAADHTLVTALHLGQDLAAKQSATRADMVAVGARNEPDSPT